MSTFEAWIISPGRTSFIGIERSMSVSYSDEIMLEICQMITKSRKSVQIGTTSDTLNELKKYFKVKECKNFMRKEITDLIDCLMKQSFTFADVDINEWSRIVNYMNTNPIERILICGEDFEVYDNSKDYLNAKYKQLLRGPCAATLHQQ